MTLCPGKLSPQQQIRNFTVARIAPIIKPKCYGAAELGLTGGEGMVPCEENHTKKVFPLLFRLLISVRRFHI